MTGEVGETMNGIIQLFVPLNKLNTTKDTYWPL